MLPKKSTRAIQSSLSLDSPIPIEKDDALAQANPTTEKG